ncbi:MAG: DUF4351 domain-containing protein [Magnetococcus sp. DMHC-1]|nr:DUF4351 domain-containing protein [Magnetococcales bacterium]
MKDSLISPAMETITPEYISQLGQEWFDFILNATPDEKLFSLPIIEHRLMQEHRAGLQAGHQDGERDGEAKVLTRQLQRRFGNLPAWVQEKIAAAEPSSLENWSLRFVDAQSLDEVFSENNKDVI